MCPGVIGLKDDAAAYIIQRIRQTAEELDLRVAPDGTCEPNLIVAVVDKAQEQLINLARSQGYMLAGLSTTAKGELLESPGAARVWLNTATRLNTGMPVPSQRDNALVPERTLSIDSASGAPMKFALPPVASGWASHSRIYFPTREDIVSVLVVFDAAQVNGNTLLQLADYATMRGLAATRETSGETAAATILALFDGEGPKPARLTQFDRAYLTRLYAGMPNLPAGRKLGNVSHELHQLQALAEPGEGQREVE